MHRLMASQGHRREQVFVLLGQADLAQALGLGPAGDLVDHRIHGDASHDLLVQVHHRRGHQVVFLEVGGRLLHAIVGVEVHRVAHHLVRHGAFGRAEQQAREWKETAQVIAAVDHDQRGRVRRQGAPPTQQAMDRLERGVLAYGDEIQVHGRAHRAGRERQHRAHLGQIGLIQLFQHRALGFVGQAGHQFRDVLGIQRPHQFGHLGGRHAPHHGAAYRVRGLQEDRAAPLLAHQRPGQIAGIGFQAFEHERDVGRMELGQALLERRLVLTGHQLGDHVLLVLGDPGRGFPGAVVELAFHRLARQQLDDLGAGLLEVAVMGRARGRGNAGCACGSLVHRFAPGILANKNARLRGRGFASPARPRWPRSAPVLVVLTRSGCHPNAAAW